MRVFISFSKYELYINLKRLILDAVAKTMKKEEQFGSSNIRKWANYSVFWIQKGVTFRLKYLLGDV